MENDTELSVAPTIHPLCYMVDEDFLVMRFWLVVVLGNVLSAISIVFNTFVFAVFITNKQHRNSYNMYLLLLAVFDVFLAIAYVSVLSNRVLINWTGSYALKSIWVKYFIEMLTVSHIAMTAQAYLITFAAIERYCITINTPLVKILQTYRKAIAICAVLCGLISKGTILKEIVVVEDPDCPGTVNQWKTEPSALVLNHPVFNKVWRFYFRNIFTIIMPFFILLYLNAGLIYRLHVHRQIAKTHSQLDDRIIVKQKKARILAATRTLVIIVCTYLMSNILNVIITFWEYIDQKGLFVHHTSFYVLAVDWISLLTLISSCLRLPIYISCQPLLRKEMKLFLTYMGRGDPTARRMTLLENGPLVQSKLLALATEQASAANQVEFV